MIAATRENKAIIFCQIGSIIICILGYLLRSSSIIVSGISTTIILCYCIIIIRIKDRSLSIVDLYYAFFSLYVWGIIALYNTKLYEIMERLGGLKLIDLKTEEVLWIDFVCGIYVSIMSVLLFDVGSQCRFDRNIEYGIERGKSSYFDIIILVICIIWACIWQKYRNVSYIEFLHKRNWVESGLLSYGLLILSPLYVLINREYNYLEKKFSTLLELMPVLVLMFLGMRSYAFILLMSIYLNWEIRGFKLNLAGALIIVGASIVLWLLQYFAMGILIPEVPIF